MVKDLGTYHLKVELEDGRGWIQQWNTGARYMKGSGSCHPLDADRISPTWRDEQELFESMCWMYLEGNYSCDCNKRLFLARAHQQGEPEKSPCGDTMTLKRLTAIHPDGIEEVIWEKR